MHPRSITNGKYDPLISLRQFTHFSENQTIYLPTDQEGRVSEILKQIACLSGLEICELEEDDVCVIDDLDE